MLQHRFRDSQGFTLTEILIAMFIFSLLGLGCWQLLSQTNISVGIHSEKARRIISINQTTQEISDDISFMLARSYRTNSLDRAPAFKGDQNSFEFIKINHTSVNDQSSHLSRVRYGLAQDNSALEPQKFIFKQVSYQIDSSKIDSSQIDSSEINSSQINRLAQDRSQLDIDLNQSNPSKLLVQGVRKFEIKYLDQDNQYSNFWPKPSDNDEASLLSLPRAIHISFDIDGIGEFYKIYEPALAQLSNENDDETP